MEGSEPWTEAVSDNRIAARALLKVMASLGGGGKAASSSLWRPATAKMPANTPWTRGQAKGHSLKRALGSAFWSFPACLRQYATLVNDNVIRASAFLLLPMLAVAGDQLEVRSQMFVSLGREESYAVLNAPQEGKPEFAILFLHGAGRDHLTLWRHPVGRAALEKSPSVMVFPRGRLSWWVNSAEGRYEDFLLELMDAVGARRWAAAGWSMGGYGSLRLVTRHPERFAAWGGLLALADFPNGDYPPEQNHSVPAVFGPKPNWAEWNPMRDVGRLRGKRLWFLTAARAFDRAMNETLSRRLKELDIAHEFRLVEGGHELKVVVEALDPMLRFLEEGDNGPK